MKKWLVLGACLLSALFGWWGHSVAEGYWQVVLVNVATMFLAVAVGVIAINIYLERHKRKGPIRSLYELAAGAMADFHNTLLDLVWTKFSKTDFQQIQEHYMEHGGDVMVVSPENRKQVYDLAKSNADQIVRLVDNLDEAMAELTSLVGWDLDPELLENTLSARHSIRSFKAISFDDSQEARNRITEHLFDTDIYTTETRFRLRELSGMK